MITLTCFGLTALLFALGAALIRRAVRIDNAQPVPDEERWP